jgi:hypothetical protein
MIQATSFLTHISDIKDIAEQIFQLLDTHINYENDGLEKELNGTANRLMGILMSLQDELGEAIEAEEEEE